MVGIVPSPWCYLQNAGASKEGRGHNEHLKQTLGVGGSGGQPLGFPGGGGGTPTYIPKKKDPHDVLCPCYFVTLLCFCRDSGGTTKCGGVCTIGKQVIDSEYEAQRRSRRSVWPTLLSSSMSMSGRFGGPGSGGGGGGRRGEDCGEGLSVLWHLLLGGGGGPSLEQGGGGVGPKTWCTKNGLTRFSLL